MTLFPYNEDIETKRLGGKSHVEGKNGQPS